MKISDIKNTDERHGVEMIQALLKFVGQSEPLETTLAKWRKMSEAEKENTVAAYAMFIN